MQRLADRAHPRKRRRLAHRVTQFLRFFNLRSQCRGRQTVFRQPGGIGPNDMADLLVGQRGEYREAADTHTQWPAHADLEREGLDREGALAAVKAETVESAPLSEEGRVAGRLRDASQRWMADLAQVETRRRSEAQLEHHRSQTIAM